MTTLAEFSRDMIATYVIPVPCHRPPKPMCRKCQFWIGQWTYKMLTRSNKMGLRNMEKKFQKHLRESHFAYDKYDSSYYPPYIPKK